MVTIIRDRVQDGVKRGQTLEQVKAAKPTLDYDARWGATSGSGRRTSSSRRSTTISARQRSSAALHDQQGRSSAGLQACLEDSMIRILRLWPVVFALALLGRSLAAQQPAAAPAAGSRARACADRSDRQLGVDRDGGLALPHGDAAQGRLRERAAQCGRARAWPTHGIRRRTRPPATRASRTAPRNIMRVPGRLHISWQDDTTLKIETDAGQQTRLLHFTGDARRASRAGRDIRWRRGKWPAALAAPARAAATHRRRPAGHSRRPGRDAPRRRLRGAAR